MDSLWYYLDPLFWKLWVHWTPTHSKLDGTLILSFIKALAWSQMKVKAVLINFYDFISNASVTSNHGPARFLSPVRFLARKAEWHARRNFTSVLFSWSHQATAPVRLDTAVHFWFGWMIRRTPWVPRAMPVRASYGPRKGIFHVFHILRDPYGPVRDPQGRRMTPFRTRKVIDTARIDKNPARASYLAVRSPHGLFMGCLGYQNPYGARKLIMHASKLYGPRTGRQNSYGAARGPWVDVRFLFKTAREQPVRGRECDVTGAKPLHNVCANQVHQFVICTICIIYSTKYHTIQHRKLVLNRKKIFNKIF